MNIVIVGNGISGITAARHIRKLSNHRIQVISSETEFFYSRTALMYIYMGHMRAEDTKPYEDWFWEKNRIELVFDHVDRLDVSQKELALRSGSVMKYDKLIIATGSKSNKFGWPGQDLNGVSGLYHYQDLEQMEAYSPGLKRAVIVGGGLIGIEMAEMFRSRDIEVTMLVREANYWQNVLPVEESKMVSRHIKEHHIDLRLGVNLGEITDDGNGNAASVIVKETGEKIDCGYVGLTAGVSPNIDFVKDSTIETDRGILVNELLQTSDQDVFAIGDCAQLREARKGRRNIEAIWYSGRMMGETAAYNICGHAIEYDPGIWFNSAKFLDIEYQVYGDVPNTLSEDMQTIYWEHPNEHKSIRINYDVKSNVVLGFNLMGIRYRHEVCEKWIQDKTQIEEVLRNLSLANFDPEFFKEYENDLIKLYNKQSGNSIQLSQKRGLSKVLRFLNRTN